jgi:hypothetical protein
MYSALLFGVYEIYCEIAVILYVRDTVADEAGIFVIVVRLQTQFGDALRTGTDRTQYTVRASEDPAQPAGMKICVSLLSVIAAASVAEQAK